MDKKIAIGAIVVVLIVVIAGVAVALTQNNGGGSPTWKEGDKIIIATNPDFAPYDARVGETFTGIDMDLVRVILYNFGLTEGKDFEFADVKFDAIILGVNQGKFTMGASGFTQNTDRLSNVLFSEEYALNNQCVVALKSNNTITADNLKTKTIVVETGTTGDILARKTYAADDSQSNIRGVTAYSDCVAQVKGGQSDCIIVDRSVAVGMVEASKTSGPELEIKNVKLEGVNEYYCFVFSKSNAQLCMAITTIMRDLKEYTTLFEDITDYYAAHDNSASTPSYWGTEAGNKLSDYKICNYKYSDFAV